MDADAAVRLGWTNTRPQSTSLSPLDAQSCLVFPASVSDYLLLICWLSLDTIYDVIWEVNCRIFCRQKQRLSLHNSDISFKRFQTCPCSCLRPLRLLHSFSPIHPFPIPSSPPFILFFSFFPLSILLILPIIIHSTAIITY